MIRPSRLVAKANIAKRQREQRDRKADPENILHEPISVSPGDGQLGLASIWKRYVQTHLRV